MPPLLYKPASSPKGVANARNHDAQDPPPATVDPDHFRHRRIRRPRICFAAVEPTQLTALSFAFGSGDQLGGCREASSS
jgi:hypothetical protein